MTDTDKIIALLERIAVAVESGTAKKRRVSSALPLKPASDPPDARIGEFIRAWNENCGDKLPKAYMPNKGTARYDNILKCLELEPSVVEWGRAIAALARSDFHTGGNARGWRANIDFLIQNGQRLKWMEEGKFRVNKKQASEDKKVVFCSECDRPATVGPGTRFPEIYEVPYCTECSGDAQ